MLAAYFLRPRLHPEPSPGRIFNAYTGLLRWSVQHYLSTVAIGVLIFAASIASMGLLSRSFLPAQNTARSLLAIELPPGSQRSDSERMTEEIVAHLRKRPEIKSIFVDGGRITPATAEVGKAALIHTFTPQSGR